MEEGPAKFKPPRKTSIASFTLMCECPPSPAFPEAGLETVGGILRSLVARYKNVMAPAQTHSTFSTTKNFLPFVERICSTNPSAFED